MTTFLGRFVGVVLLCRVPMIVGTQLGPDPNAPVLIPIWAVCRGVVLCGVVLCDAWPCAIGMEGDESSCDFGPCRRALSA
jgi:hypothetical protein